MRNRPKRPVLPAPSEGGSYVVDKKGNLARREHTAGPLDPDHESRRPRPPEAAAPAKEV